MTKLCLWLSLIIICSCTGTTTRTIKNPKYVSELRGYIKPNKKKYQIGEEVTVNYVISNVSSSLHQELVTDGSKNPKEAFSSYNFNAQASNGSLDHLELKDFGKPISGAISLKPRAEKTFVRNTFIASKAGKYLLSFTLDWRDNKGILFQPVAVEVIDPNAAKEVEEPSEKVNPQLLQYVRDLTSQDPDTKNAAKEAIIEYGDNGLVAVVEAMGDEDPTMRSAAMLFLIEDVSFDAIPLLLTATKHEKAEIRMRSIYAIGEIDPSEAIPVLKDILINDSSKDVRLAAFQVVQVYADAIAVQLSIFALQDEDVEVRKAAITALKNRTERDFGYDPEGSKNDRRKSILAWQEWASRKYRGN